MSNSNTNLQTQSSNALHNAIMEAGSKERHQSWAPGNYFSGNPEIKNTLTTKPNMNSSTIVLQNPPYTYQWLKKTVPVLKIILNRARKYDIYSTVDACPNALGNVDNIERLKIQGYQSMYKILKLFKMGVWKSTSRMVNHLNRITHVFYPDDEMELV
ncbi:hypothetical protein Tco_1468169 [Tanacetum coccineum]